MNDVIHFAHGNGFPSLCYKQLLNALETRYRCCYIDSIGHNPTFPVTENWHCLVDEIIDSVKSCHDEPVIAVGHSLGGVLSLLAAYEQPGLFKAVVMIDSPILGRFKSNMVRLAKSLGIIDHVTPAFRTRGRRKHWQSREQVYEYLRSRPLFKTFTDLCLHDYINFGLQEVEDGFKLRFDPHIEYLIYRTVPHHLASHIREINVPTALIYGESSDVVGRIDVNYMRKRFNIRCIKMKGTHMLPMETPEKVAEQIFTLLDSRFI